jgi:hypothetical protein
MHSLINFKTFLGNSAFDTIPIYQSLLQKLGFEKVYISLNNRSNLKGGEDYTINDDGIPCCPHDPLSSYETGGKYITPLLWY